MTFVVRLLGGIALLGVLALLRGPVNAALRVLFDAVLFPFRGMHPLVGLTVLAVPFAVLALVLFKATSDQAALEKIKAKIHAGLFEIRLFNDDIRAILRAQFEILAHNGRYFLQNLVPLLWMIGPFVFVMGQLQFQYGFEGLTPGESALLKVQLDGQRAAARPEAALTVPDGLEAETAPVWFPARNELVWRLGARAEGSYDVRVQVGGEEVTKSVRVGEGPARRSPLRVSPAVLDEILNPAEAPLPKGAGIASISLDYPEAVGNFAELSAWVWAWVGLTMVIAFALRGKFGVTI
jgi:hypothetical protein